MAWQATHRFAKISPQKARLIADMIRGRNAQQALEVLKFSHQRAARLIEKVLRSAMANADEQGQADLEELTVSGTWVNEGPRMKRFQPKDRGRAHPILKRTSHITVQVEESQAVGEQTE